jgi:hypothetical protein
MNRDGEGREEKNACRILVGKLEKKKITVKN